MGGWRPHSPLRLSRGEPGWGLATCFLLKDDAGGSGDCSHTRPESLLCL